MIINFLNCIYYNKLRIKIKNEFEIIDIEFYDVNFIDTKQKVINFIIRKNKSDNSKYYLNINKIISFNTIKNINEINLILKVLNLILEM